MTAYLTLPRRARRVRRSALVLLTAASLLPIAPAVGAAPAEPTAQTAQTAQTPESAQGGLQWSLRPSFNNYTGGPVVIDEGATEVSRGNFNFPLASQSYDADEQRMEAQFSGRVIYKQYCPTNDPVSDPNCSLDLTFKNPKVVIDDDGSYLEATVSSKQYPQGGVYAPAHPVKIATLDTSSATFTESDGEISWANIATVLTQEGNSMFSNFYTVGEALGPLSFKYRGKGARPDGAGSGVTYGGVWSSPGVYDNPVRTFAYGEKIVTAVAGEGVALLDADLKQLAYQPASISSDNVAAFDAATGTFYFAESNGSAVKAVHVDASAGTLSEPAEVGIVSGVVQAMAVHPATGKLSVLSQDDDKHAFLSTQGAQQFREQALPATDELFDFAIQKAYSNAYTGGFRLDDIQEMLPMADGTFLFNANADVYADGASETIKGTLLRFDPAATTPAAAAHVVPGTPRQDSNDYFNGLATDGRTVVRYNNFDGEGSIFQVLDYAEGKLSARNEPAPQPGIGTVADVFVADGRILALDATDGAVVTVTPEGAVSQRLLVTNAQRTNKPMHAALLARGRHLYVPTQDENGGDWRGGAFRLQDLVTNQPTPVDPGPTEPTKSTGPSTEPTESTGPSSSPAAPTTSARPTETRQPNRPDSSARPHVNGSSWSPLKIVLALLGSLGAFGVLGMIIAPLVQQLLR